MRDKQYWPWLNSNVEHTINHRPQDRLNGLAPITVMTGLLAENPLEEIFRCPYMEFGTVKMDKSQIRRCTEVLQRALEEMHNAVTLAEASLPNPGGYSEEYLLQPATYTPPADNIPKKFLHQHPPCRGLSTTYISHGLRLIPIGRFIYNEIEEI